MSLSGIGQALALATLLGGLVALPRADALDRLHRLRSPLWAAVLPGSIVLGTAAPLAAHSMALALVVLAAVATPPLAALAVLAVVRGPRAPLLGLAVAAGALAPIAGGWAGELSTTLLTALGCLALGTALARLIPVRWMLAGMLCMCAADVALLAAGAGHSAAAMIAGAAIHVPGAVFDQAQVGQLTLDYPDMVLAAVLGGCLTGRHGHRRGAALVAALAACCFALAPAGSMWPATVPIVVAVIVLRTVGLPRERHVTALARSPALT
jgi:hypothetical protein